VQRIDKFHAEAVRNRMGAQSWRHHRESTTCPNQLRVRSEARWPRPLYDGIRTLPHPSPPADDPRNLSLQIEDWVAQLCRPPKAHRRSSVYRDVQFSRTRPAFSAYRRRRSENVALR